MIMQLPVSWGWQDGPVQLEQWHWCMPPSPSLHLVLPSLSHQLCCTMSHTPTGMCKGVKRRRRRRGEEKGGRGGVKEVKGEEERGVRGGVRTEGEECGVRGGGGGVRGGGGGVRGRREE